MLKCKHESQILRARAHTHFLAVAHTDGVVEAIGEERGGVDEAGLELRDEHRQQVQQALAVVRRVGAAVHHRAARQVEEEQREQAEQRTRRRLRAQCTHRLVSLSAARHPTVV